MDSVFFLFLKLLDYYFLVPLIFFPILFFFKKRLHNHHLHRRHPPPSPPRLPVIGNLHQVGPLPLRSLKSLAENHGPVMLLHLGSTPTLIISSADAAEQVLRQNDRNFADRVQLKFVGKLSYGFSDMIFAPYGEYWRQMRAIGVSQLLSSKRVQSFRKVREEEVHKTLEKVTKSISTSICMREIIETLTYNIVFRVSIGKRYDCEALKALLQGCNTLGGYLNVGDFIPWLGWIINHFNGMEAKANRHGRQINAYLEEIIDEAIKIHDHKGEDDDEHEISFLDRLLQLQRKDSNLHRDSIKALIMDIVLGGTDTTSSLLEWIFSELLRNPHTMKTLQNEVRNCRSNDKTLIIAECELKELPYLKAIIKEALRMHPSIGLIPRQTRESVKIHTFDVAPKTPVFINTLAIGRDPSLWEEPDEFRPERFLVDSNVDSKGQHFQYIPFGSGRRMCPGSGFALATVELALANLILKFDFVLPNGIKPEELDMTEMHGMVNTRKTPLFLVPSLPI